MNDPTVGEATLGPFREMWERVTDYLPTFAAGLLILLLGLAVSWLIKIVVKRILLLTRLDRPLGNVRWARGLAQADVRHTLANVLASIAAGIVFLIFLDNAVLVWRLKVLGQLLGGLVFYVPRLIVGLLVLAIGSLVAGAVAGRVRAGLAAEGFARAILVARLTRWALMIVVAAFTLEELGIAPVTVAAAVKIGLGSVGLVLVLALGLGSREAVARMWRTLLEKPDSD